MRKGKPGATETIVRRGDSVGFLVLPILLELMIPSEGSLKVSCGQLK